jgi:hypothetical protein
MTIHNFISGGRYKHRSRNCWEYYSVETKIPKCCRFEQIRACCTERFDEAVRRLKDRAGGQINIAASTYLSEMLLGAQSSTGALCDVEDSVPVVVDIGEQLRHSIVHSCTWR